MTIEESQRRILTEIRDIGDMAGVYEYLIECGKDEYPLDSRFRTPEYEIGGCQSNVWLRAELTGGVLVFSGDSDARFTKGVLNMLLRIVDHHSPGDVADADLFILEEAGLVSHLSPARVNGLHAMVEHIKSCARAYR